MSNKSTRKVLNQFDRNRVTIAFGKETRTKQSFKKECDINNIMAKFQKNRIIDHINQNQKRFGDLTGYDFAQAQNTLAEANSMYEELPSLVRAEFSGPGEFLDFVQNPENVQKMVELGLANERPESHDVPATRADLQEAIKNATAASEKPSVAKSDDKKEAESTVPS